MVAFILFLCGDSWDLAYGIILLLHFVFKIWFRKDIQAV